MVVHLAEVVGQVRAQVGEEPSGDEPILAERHGIELVQPLVGEVVERAVHGVGRRAQARDDLAAGNILAREFPVAVPCVLRVAEYLADEQPQVSRDVQRQVPRGVARAAGRRPQVRLVL